ncbi:MAG TPA: SwmB domain-containing protein, partial [Prochlorococcaceae cyanobacterium Fu_MAG_50]|nr:SwmB domain-containing protein [Prochlorococcaceae cyanobacterium Fu_MAG_50]
VQGNDLISLSQQIVGNDTEDASQLSLDQGEVVEADQILLNFSKQLNDTEPAASRFKVLVNNNRNRVDSIQISADEGQVILNMKRAMTDVDTVTLSYNDLANDQNRKVIEDTSGNDLATVKNFSIENFVIDAEAPFIDDAEFSNDQITLYFNEELAATNVKNSRFKVTVDGKRNKVSSIEVAEEDTIVSLALRKMIKADSDVLISYKDPKKNQKKGVLEDLAGNDVESFRDFLAVHIDDGTGPSLRIVAPEEPLRGLFERNPVLEGAENLLPW